MGAYRSRRPFVWQDEMAEVRNLFRKVAQVRDSGFTGFSLWKDEPTAETLSRNRLRRRRCQYALELTHLNYGESPYEALNHLHNIRGMCSRIQRQDRYVERKKKDYDLDLQPALLRRPVTASYSWASASAKEGSDKGSLRSARPCSAPVLVDTPLHYTPSKPTMLYDATHRRSRYKDVTKRSPMLMNPSGISHNNRLGRTALKAMATNNHNWETLTVASTGYNSSPLPSSSYIASSTRTNLKGAPSGAAANLSSSRCSADSSPNLDESIPRRKEYLEPAYAEVEVETASDVDNTTTAASVLYSEVESTDASMFSPSRPGTQAGSASVERPPSRMMSKRPSPDATKVVNAENRGGNVAHRRDVHAPSGESAGHEVTGFGSIFASSPSPATQLNDVLPARPPSRKSGENGRRVLEEQRCSSKSNPAAAATTKGKSALCPPDGTAGLWALRQEQQRPTSAGAGAMRAAAASSEQGQNGRPATSPTRVTVQNFPRQERVSRFGSSPSANKIAGKKEQLQVRAVQRAFDQELQQVVLSEYVSDETQRHTSTRSEQQEVKPPVVSPGQPHQQPRQYDAFDSGCDSFEQTSLTSASARANEQTTTATTGGDESHVMIRHSTDPYADFKFSMLRMIDEEDLYDKQWELEELFQYYMDLNPAVHHEVLQLVIFDIRKNIATYKTRRCYADSP